MKLLVQVISTLDIFATVARNNKSAILLGWILAV